jgi:hypothetical protein
MHVEKNHVQGSWRVFVALACVAVSMLIAATPASASYEQVETFGGTIEPPAPPGNFPEKAQLGTAGGVAINVTGAGGVPAGTMYVATQDPDHLQGPLKIVRYGPDGSFRMAWTTTSERCGTPESLPACPSHAVAGRAAVDVEVDQATGNVYAFNGEKANTGEKLIQVFNATGTSLITEFGERTNGQTTAASPEKLHGASGLPGGIAVDSSGNVYVFDINSGDGFRFRLMKFQPQTPGDFSKYVYAGEGQDVQPGSIKPGSEAKLPSRPVVDDAGDIYVAGENYIQKLDPGKPAEPTLCTFFVKGSGVRGMGVNPETDEVFFYNYKDREIHQLGSCSEGVFTEVGSFSPAPQRGYLEALAVNPTLNWEPASAAGVLYGVSPEAIGEAGGGEPGQSGLGYVFVEAELHEPVIESQSVSQVSFDSATLKALVNPKGSSTSYVFEYLTDAAYQANEPADRFAGAGKAPLGGSDLGNGVEPVMASAEISGLLSGTLYHYRVVATSSQGIGTGEGQTFQTFPFNGIGLPDRRAYELVSPVQKDGGEVYPINPRFGSCQGECKPGISSASLPVQSALSGDAVAYEGSAFSFSGGAVLENEYVAERTHAGWQTIAMSHPLQSSGEGTGSKVFNPELTKGILYQGLPTLSSSAPAEYFNLYRQSTSTPSALSPLLLQAPPNRPPGPSLKLTYAGASVDLSRVFFEVNDALTEATSVAPAAEDGGLGKNNLYEWRSGQIRLVNVEPGNAEAPAGAAFGRPTNSEGTVKAVLSHAVSDDGSRVFWSSPTGQVYVREAAETTRAIPDAGEFLGASADGVRVLLTDGHLYDLDANTTTDLSSGAGGFVGVVGSSEDLSSIYFVDSAVLDETENDFGSKAQVGSKNLYVWQEGDVSYVATLSPADSAERIGDWTLSPIQRTAKASPDGRWLAFQSVAPLTKFDSTGPCGISEGKTVPGPCNEVFLFDSATGELRCPSCKASEEAPLGSSSVPRRQLNAEGSLPPPSFLTNSGRLYFDSKDSLSPFDTNEGVEDVYQFEPSGVGTCGREAGCVSLISAGSGSVDSNFAAADPSGGNVFFTSRDQLVVTDRDELLDLYDARVDGGFTVPPVAEECRGEGCQPLIPSPSESTPSSPNFVGPGNVKPPKRCKKGKVKRNGHCVKKAKKAKHRSRNAKEKRGGAA